MALLIRHILILFISLTFSSAVLSQVATGSHNVQLTIPVVALLDIEPNITPITLAFNPPSEAGLPITVSSGGTNNTKRLNYTSSIASGGASKKITVQVTSGSVPPGVNLMVQASAATGGGAGTKGSPVGLVTLNGTAKNLITGIGRCYTGDGPSNGHQLTYSLSISNYSLLNYQASNTVQITYTISD